MGHGHSRSKRSHQQDADHKPLQAHHGSGGSEAPLDIGEPGGTDPQGLKVWGHGVCSGILRPVPALSSFSLLPAPCHRGLMHAQAGDGGLPEEVQCPEEAKGNSCSLLSESAAKCTGGSPGGVRPVGKGRVGSVGGQHGADGDLGIPL